MWSVQLFILHCDYREDKEKMLPAGDGALPVFHFNIINFNMINVSLKPREGTQSHVNFCCAILSDDLHACGYKTFVVQHIGWMLVFNALLAD